MNSPLSAVSEVLPCKTTPSAYLSPHTRHTGSGEKRFGPSLRLLPSAPARSGEMTPEVEQEWPGLRKRAEVREGGEVGEVGLEGRIGEGGEISTLNVCSLWGAGRIDV